MQHESSLYRRALAALATIALITAGLLVAAAPAGAATTVTGYRAIPTSIPANVPSQPFQAQQTSEFGDSVGLANSGYLSTTRVLMSSWGCESGSWNTNDCVTTPGATFAVPITFNLYTVSGGQPGSLIGSKTQTFNIPYRPSRSGICTGPDAGKWYDGVSSNCYNGYATPITFDFSQTPTLVPSNVIWTVSYNTSGYGPAPLGYSNPCNSTPQGCGYDSLNVGLDTNPSTYVGTDTDTDGVIWNTSTASNYCDGGAGGSGTLRLDTAPGCWAGYRPMGELNISSIPLVTTSNISVPEGNSGPHTVSVPVNLSAPTTQTVIVKWKTRSLTASVPADYTAATGTVTFSPGQYSTTVPVTVVGDRPRRTTKRSPSTSRSRPTPPCRRPAPRSRRR